VGTGVPNPRSSVLMASAAEGLALPGGRRGGGRRRGRGSGQLSQLQQQAMPNDVTRIVNYDCRNDNSRVTERWSSAGGWEVRAQPSQRAI
jgi:hypothetical protein